MNKKKNKKTKESCLVKSFFCRLTKNSVFRLVGFVVMAGIIFFLIGGLIWGTKQVFVEKIGTEKNEHQVRIESKLVEMQEKIDFFQETLNKLQENNFISVEESRKIHENIRSLSGDLKDLERYYLDQRFDYSLIIFGENSEESEKFEQIKKMTRDGELFLNNMALISLSSRVDERAMELTQYNFKVFEEGYVKAFSLF